jgi:WD40 repeat protein
MSRSSSHVQTLTAISPKGPYVAGLSQGSRVVVRTVPSMAVHALYEAVDRVDEIKWSPAGNLLLAVVGSQGVVHVWSVDDLEWNARIDSGNAGLKTAFFHPIYSNCMFTVSDFGMRLRLWSLDDGRMIHTYGNVPVGPVLSPNGKRIAMIDCLSAKSNLIVYTGERNNDEPNMVPVALSQIELENARVSDLWWTADSMSVILRCSADSRQSLRLIDAFTGKPKRDAPVSIVDGRVIEGTRGLIALGCADESVKFFSTESGLDYLGCISLRESKITIVSGLPVVYKETLGGDASISEKNLFMLGGSVSSKHPVEYREIVPVEVIGTSAGTIDLPTSSSTNLGDGSPRVGVCRMRVSHDSQWLAVQTDEKACVIFVIQLAKLRLVCALVHRQPVREFRWNPNCSGVDSEMCVATGDSWVHVWRPFLSSHTIQMNDASLRPISVDWIVGLDYLIADDGAEVLCIPVEASVSKIGGS